MRGGSTFVLQDHADADLARKLDQLDVERPGWDRRQTVLACAHALSTNTVDNAEAAKLYGAEIAQEAREFNVATMPGRATAARQANGSLRIAVRYSVKAIALPMVTFALGVAGAWYAFPKYHLEQRWIAVSGLQDVSLRDDIIAKLHDLNKTQAAVQEAEQLRNAERVLKELLAQRQKLDKLRLELHRNVVSLEANSRYIASASKKLPVGEIARSLPGLANQRWPSDFSEYLVGR